MNCQTAGGVTSYRLARAGIVALFLLPYVLLNSFVGLFPAEDVGNSLDDANLRAILCVPNNAARDTSTKREALDKKLSLLPGPAGEHPPGLEFDDSSMALPTRVIDNLDSLYISRRAGRIVALDEISEHDYGVLWTLGNRHQFSSRQLDQFVIDAEEYYPPCDVPPIDSGVTEGYWATKGTSVLHHWAHLYESSVSGGRARAQYGFLVPLVSRAVVDVVSSPGPTNFVRVAWVVYATCGVAYLALFLAIFRAAPRLAIGALLIKVAIFCRLGAFPILLAPGYHWSRELVILSVMAILKIAGDHVSTSCITHAWRTIVAVGVGLSFCYLLDPTFFLVSLCCAVLASLWSGYANVIRRLASNRRNVVVAAILIGIVLVTAIYLQADNFLYVIDKLVNNDHGLFVVNPHRLAITMAICIAAIALLYVTWGDDDCFVSAYFSFVTLFSSLYFFITPDRFHFLKFLEYSVPFGVVLMMALGRLYGERLLLRVASFQSELKFVSLIGYLVLVTVAVANLVSQPASFELRTRDQFGEPYFQTVEYMVNGRVIKADMSEALAEHLRSFPDNCPSNYILSPFDKYLIFLYDRRNGFESPDFVPWLDSERKLDSVLGMLTGGDAPVDVLIDDAIFDVAFRSGISRSHPVLGAIDGASKLNVKARLRASELASALMERCALVNDLETKGWRHIRCGGST